MPTVSDRGRIPKYRLHRPSGQAVVTLGGRDFYLGRHKSKESKVEYARRLAEWNANQGASAPSGNQPSDFTIAELLAAFTRWAKTYYVQDGQNTDEVACLKSALRFVKQLYAQSPAASFGPLALKAVRQSMVDAGWARGHVNHQITRVRRVFRWGVENQLVEPSVLQGLQAVAPLKAGRCQAPESKPVRPVPEAWVNATVPFLTPTVAGMVRVQLLAGMRPGEVCLMRGADINMTGRIWEYVPRRHKNQWRGHVRRVFLGPEAQAIVKEFLQVDLEAFLLSPAKSLEERNTQWRATRKTKVQPSQMNRRKRRPVKQAGERYDTASYRRAIHYAIQRANKEREEAGQQAIPNWHPNQLRHTAATRLRREFTLDAARAVLGHKSLDMAAHYAEVDSGIAQEAMLRIG
ncbi:MAG: tyrosine-type recombinase/integrase [Pirellulales bacterium]